MTNDDPMSGADARAEAWGEYRDSPEYAPTDRYPVQPVFEAGWDAHAEWQASRPADGETSDGYHTFDELYEYRMLYHAHAVRSWEDAGIPVVKSLRHSDGELCFGGGWFIVSAELPGVGQITNHYKTEHWNLFDIPEVQTPPEYDGHSPADVADRLRSWLLMTRRI